MPIIAWIFLGLIAGYIGSKVLGDEGDGLLQYLALGVVGAVVGAWLLHTQHPSSNGELDLWTALAAVVGAVGALAAHRTVRRRTAT